MAAKKEEVTHDSLIKNIAEKEKELKKAKQDYNDFCKENPFKAPQQPSLHELRKLREKNNKATLEDHQKANKAAAANAQKEQLKQELKGE